MAGRTTYSADEARLVLVSDSRAMNHSSRRDEGKRTLDGYTAGGNWAQNRSNSPDSYAFKTAPGSRNGFSVMVIPALPVINTNVPVNFPRAWLINSPCRSPLDSKT